MNYPTRYIFLLQISVFLLFLFRANAATDSIPYTHYDVTNGLPSNNVYGIIQDHNGYIWLATDKGAVRFNGYNFKVFNTATGLPSDDVYHLEEDSKGRIWVYTLTPDFGYIDRENYHTLHFPHHELKALNPGPIMEYFGYTFFAYSAGLENFCAVVDTDIKYCISGAAINGQHFIQGDNCDIYLCRNAIYCRVAFHHPDDIKWYITDINHFPLITREINNATDSAAAEGNYFITDSDCGQITLSEIFIFRMPECQLTKIDLKHRYFVPGEILYVVTYDKKTMYTYVFSTRNIYTFNKAYKLINKEPIRNGKLDNAQVANYMKDFKGKTWYCTNSAGVWINETARQTPKYNSSFRHARKLTTTDKHLSFWYDMQSDLLYSFDTAGKYQIAGLGISKNIGRAQCVLTWSDSARDVYGANGHISYNGSHKTGDVPNRTKIILIDRILNQQQLLDSSHREMHQNNILAAVKTGPGQMLGLKSFQPQSMLFGKDSVIINCHQRIRLDHVIPVPFCNRLFLAYNTRHIFCYNAQVDTGFIIEPGIFSPELKQLRSIAADSSGNIFLLTSSELVIYNWWHRRLSTIRHFFNLNNAQLDVSGHNLLLAGNFGIAATHVSSNGCPGNFHCIENAGNNQYVEVIDTWLSENSRIFVNTEKGMLQTTVDNVQHHGKLYDSSNSPFTLIAARPYNREVHKGDTLLLEQNNDQLGFDAINFYGIGEVIYQYRIKELSLDWQQTRSGEILLKNISPEKHYTLQLKLKDNAWQSGILNFTLYRPPYWYQTHTWKIIGWICLGILLILSVFGVVSITRYAVIRAQAKKQMMTDLELRAIHSQINPHFIFNTLSTALYFISRKEYDNAYGHVNKFSHLLRSYLKSSHDRYVILSEEIEMLKRYIELQEARFEQRFTYSITVDNKLPAVNIQIPSLLLQPLVENAINHGLFHKKEAGWLKIGFEQGSNHTELICTIEDNGVGREQAKFIKQESAVRKESFGTKLTDKLVKIFRQYEEMDISIEYTDKQLPETGTIVTLTVRNVKYLV